MFDRWEIMFLGLLGIILLGALFNLARIAFCGRKPQVDEHASHPGI